MAAKGLTSLRQCADMAIRHQGENKHYPCDIELDLDGELVTAYEVSICDGDLLFFTDKGTVNYLVDNYRGRAVVELFNVDMD